MANASTVPEPTPKQMLAACEAEAERLRDCIVDMEAGRFDFEERGVMFPDIEAYIREARTRLERLERYMDGLKSAAH
ncbi:hypothetical protein [Kumtagia ephedrae]|uniref:Uncharacterized protein n=1 Tax=Kumtagia ephedrae TaxID=2116701 RepID=A0A2P7SPS6_9HYPH|nr:hypothetical protein [Mesorhizobium ephedrae]PSJ64520.1 hypothetical protein C7I84_06145 [Mesorhizobium ephedrae]